MTERSTDGIDRRLRGVAMGAVTAHERTVTTAETDAALVAVRARAAAGEMGEIVEPIGRGPARGRRRSPWVLVGSAAAALALFGVGIVAVIGDGPDDRLVPGSVPGSETVPAPDAAPTVPATSLPPASVVTPTTPPATDDVASAGETQTLSVDAANPPRLVEPVPYASVPLAPNPDGRRTEFAVGLDHVVVNQPDTGSFTIVGPDGSAREVSVEEEVSQVVSGPGPVVYGLGGPVFSSDTQAMPDGFRFVAIPFLGEREGEVVASTVVDVNTFLELPPFFFGHGSNGVVARGRTDETVIGYVDEAGAARDSGESGEFGTAFPTYDLDRSDGGLTVTDIDGGQTWRLDVTRDIGWVSPFIDDTVVAPGAGRAIYFERIGLNTTPGSDFGTNLLPVVALMNPDGSGEWVRLPDDWDVVASDVWGTLLARFTDDAIELASLEDIVPVAEPVADSDSDSTPPEPAPTTTEPVEVFDSAASGDLPAVQRQCASQSDCTSIVVTADGRIVTLDPLGVSLRVHDSAGEEVLLDQPVAAVLDDADPELVAVGPDDVAYVRTFPVTGDESAGELLAIPLVGPRAGTVVQRATGLPVSGGTAVIPRRTGLAVFLCCGNVADGTFPPADVRVEPWVDRNGDVIERGAPVFDLDVGDAGNSLVRTDAGDPQVRTSFPLPASVGTPLIFPDVVQTSDGGLAAYISVSLGVVILVDMNPDWPRNRVDNGDVYYVPISDFVGGFEPETSGSVIVATGDGFVRRTLDELATPGWPGTPVTDAGQGTTTADDLNEYIDEMQPFWAADPALFAYQLVQTLGPNESVSVEFDDAAAPIITITTTGLLDDSADAVRRIVTTSRSDDGLLRFESATYGFRCARGPDTESFQNEPCP